MDNTWYNWIPSNTPKTEEVTPEDFSESLWHLAEGQAEQTPKQTKPNTRTAQQINFDNAPQSIRKAWIDSDEDHLYPSPKPRTESPFSFARMSSSNKRSDNLTSPGEKGKISRPVDGDESPTSGVAAKSLRSIRPNGTAPIGSEVAQLKQRRAALTQATYHDPGEETDSEKTFQRVCGMPLKEFNKDCDDTHEENSGVSKDSSGGVKLPTETVDKTPKSTSMVVTSNHSRKRSTSSTSSTVTVTPARHRRIESVSSSVSASSKAKSPFANSPAYIPSAEPAVGPAVVPSTAIPMGLGALAPPLLPPTQLTLSPRISAEGIAAMQAQARRDVQNQLITSFDKQLCEMRLLHKHELAEKDRQLGAAKKELNSVKKMKQAENEELGAKVRGLQEDLNTLREMLERFRLEYGAKIKQSFKTAVNDVTPTNQVVFQEPATSVDPARQQLVLFTKDATPSQQIIRQEYAPSTYPGAKQPGRDANHGGYQDSPEFVVQTHHVAATNGGTANATNKQLHVAANPEDDVFADPYAEMGPGLKYFFGTRGFEQRGLKESFTACFSKIEGVLRITPMVQMTGRPRSEKAVRKLVTKCQEHIMHRGEAMNMLEHSDEKYILITGVFNRVIVDYIFKAPVTAAFQCIYQAELTHWWNEELATFQKDITNSQKRSWLGKQRAEMVNLVVQLPGFWTWVQQYTHTMLDKVVREIEAAFQPAYIPALRANLWRPVNDAMRLAIRMSQDPRIFTFNFQMVGCTWDNGFMIQRNPELVGQELGNVRTPYCTRCTARPLVKVKDLDANNSNGTVIHRAEVLVSDRKNTLRPNLRPGRYRR